MKKLTQTQFAEHIGTSRQNVSKLINKGIINLANGADKCRLDYIENLRLQAAGRSSDGDYDLTAERARLAHFQAEKTEMEAATMRGELIPAEIVERFQGGMVLRMRNKLLAIPSKAAYELSMLSEPGATQAKLKELIYEVLYELAEFRPEDYGIENSVQPEIDND